MAALTPQDIIQFGAVRRNCENRFTVDPTSIERARAGEVVNDPEFDCMVACVLDGMNLMTPDGRLNANAALSKLPEGYNQGAVANAINSCANERGRNKCETAHRLYVCLNATGISKVLSGR
nr:odorant-binding protein 8 [Gregopimpla kuwanae]